MSSYPNEESSRFEHGNITEEGTHENLMARRGVYYTLSTTAGNVTLYPKFAPQAFTTQT